MTNAVTVISATGVRRSACVKADFLAGRREIGAGTGWATGWDGLEANGAGRTGKAPGWSEETFGAGGVAGVKGFGTKAGLLGAATSMTGLVGELGCISNLALIVSRTA
jgi:hypothetical protein